MRVHCEAILDNAAQLENLCQCINIIGGIPVVSNDTVSIECDNEDAMAEKLIDLFEHYSRRSIRIYKD